MHLLLRRFKKLLTRPELVLLVAIGFYLRIIGTNPGYYAHGDELMYGEAVYMILNKTLSMQTNVLGFYPPLVAWIMLVSFIFFFIPLSFLLKTPTLLGNFLDTYSIWGSMGSGSFFSEIITGENWANTLYWGRYLTVIFGVGTIILTYVLARKLFQNRALSFLSALFVTINYRLVLNSKIGFLDIYGVFFLVLALIAVVNLYSSPSKRNYYLAWIAVTLSFLVKYQVYSLPPLFLAHLLICLKGPDKNVISLAKQTINRNFVLGGLMSLTVVLFAHYYHFINWSDVKTMYEYQALKYSVGSNYIKIYPISYLYHVALGPISSITCLAGLVLLMAQKKRRVFGYLIFIFVATFTFFYFYYTSGGAYTRNLLVLIPIAYILSAYFWVYAWKKFVVTNKSTFLKICFAFVALSSFVSIAGVQLNNAIVANEVLSTKSGRFQILEWVKDIPYASRVGIFQESWLPESGRYSKINLSSISEVLSFKELEAEDVDFALLDLYEISGRSIWWIRQPTNIGLVFWEKPNNLLAQSYPALAARELLGYHTLQAYLPKWQISGYNFALFEIKPDSRDANYSLFKQYDFNEDNNGWKRLNFFEETSVLLKSEGGMLSINSEDSNIVNGVKRVLTNPGMIRWESPALKADGDYVYKIEADVKSDTSIEKHERNGFVRLDFYEKPVEQTITSRAQTSFVSERYYGNPGWKTLTIEGISPRTAKYLVVGFQADQAKNNFYLDEVRIYKSEKKTENASQPRITIDDDDLFPPNDGGFL